MGDPSALLQLQMTLMLHLSVCKFMWHSDCLLRRCRSHFWAKTKTSLRLVSFAFRSQSLVLAKISYIKPRYCSEGYFLIIISTSSHFSWPSVWRWKRMQHLNFSCQALFIHHITASVRFYMNNSLGHYDFEEIFFWKCTVIIVFNNQTQVSFL